ncbi:MAG: ATP-binding cassette domain-containing protein [Burkholderiales bacterium]|nr:ATP-binding cassette domain-containing protein [Phycisphaerae bacterium]
MNPAHDIRNAAAVQIKDIAVLRGQRVILEDICWTVEAGQHAAILGPNGSGKSTLARILLGYLWPTRGSVVVAGRVFGETNLHDLRKLVRLVQPNGPFQIDDALSTRDAVSTGFDGTLGVYDACTDPQRRVVEEWLERVGLAGVADSAFGHLSTGERVRALLARALVGGPQVLILDEPTAGLDIRGREELLSALSDLAGDSRGSPTIIMVTHHVEDLLPSTSNILLLDRGQAAAVGTLPEVLRPELLSRVYNCPVDVRQINGRYYLHATSRSWLGKRV